jgi:hypothetical protein
MVLNHHDVSVCLQHPGFDIDMLLTADIATFFQVWLGRSTLAGAFLVRAFGGWWAWSPVADTVRATAARPITERDTDPH